MGTWRKLLSPAAFASRPGHKPIVVTLTNGRGQRHLLEQIHFEPPQAREYIAKALNAGLATSGMYGATDPVVDALSVIGPEYCDVLIEPLVLFKHINGDIWLVAALERIADERHKELIIDALVCAPDLLEVVNERGWSSAAAGTVLSAVRSRSPDTPVDWVVFAAKHGTPEDYPHLKWYLIHGPNPRYLWNAIGHLFDPGQLRPMLHEAWRGKDRKRYFAGWGQLVVVAAECGDQEALGELALDMAEGRIMKGREVFRALTGFEGNDTSAEQWFEVRAATLRFNPTERRYSVSDAAD